MVQTAKQIKRIYNKVVSKTKFSTQEIKLPSNYEVTTLLKLEYSQFLKSDVTYNHE